MEAWKNMPTGEDVYRELFGMKDNEVVTVHTGEFDRLDTFVGPIYCNCITFRNLKDITCTFNYRPNIIHRVLGQVYRMTSKELLKNGSVAYRNTVPMMFRSCPQLAGDLGLNEFLVDGTHVRKASSIEFMVNPETQIIINFVNCSGYAVFNGTTKDNIRVKYDPDCMKISIFENSGK
jgi:hypothetical protein